MRVAPILLLDDADDADLRVLMAAQPFLYLHPVMDGDGDSRDDERERQRILACLRGLYDHPGEPITLARLGYVRGVLEAVIAAAVRESTADYWLARATGREPSDLEKRMARVLAEERARAARTVAEASAVLRKAIDLLMRSGADAGTGAAA